MPWWPRLTLGHVGLIVSSDVTRLSRNCSDWYPLLDLCGYKGCLIADTMASMIRLRSTAGSSWASKDKFPNGVHTMKAPSHRRPDP